MDTRKTTKTTAGAAAALALLAGCSSGVDAAPTEPSVPQVCLDALDAADRVHELSGEAFIVAGDSIDAASRMDIARMEQLIADIDDLAPQIESGLDEYRSARAACVGGDRA